MKYKPVVSIALWLFCICKADPLPVSDGGNCNVSMVEGRLTSRCQGSFIVLYRGKTEVHACGNVSTTYYSPISATVGPCSTLLLDHAICSHQDRDSPCYQGKASIFICVASVLSVLMASCLVIIIRLRCSLGRDGITTRDVIVEKSAVTLCLKEDTVKLTWKSFLLTYLLCFDRTSGLCTEPMSSHSTMNYSVFNFRLRVGQSACFEDGRVEHIANKELYSLDHLYDTSKWEEYVWSYNGCGNGEYCGSKEDCGAYGSIGQVKAKRGGFYKKVCRTYSVGVFSCVSYWACWVATLEVNVDSSKKYAVYSIGESENQDQYEKFGLIGCTVEMSSQRPTMLAGKFLVHLVGSRDSWLCSMASEHSFPIPGKLGDIQHIGEEPVFNFDAFSCELESSSSSGACKVTKSFIPSIDEWCQSLPMLIDGGKLSFSNGSLVMDNSGFDDFHLQFRRATVPVSSPHNCYSRSVKLVGIKGDRGLFMYIFQAFSTDNSTWVIHSNCSTEPLEINCDGQFVAHHLSHSDDQICSFDGEVAVDGRSEPREVDWVWDEASHDGLQIGYHLSKWSLIIIGLVLILFLFRVFCR